MAQAINLRFGYLSVEVKLQKTPKPGEVDVGESSPKPLNVLVALNSSGFSQDLENNRCIA
jgi:hypothetical protein